MPLAGTIVGLLENLMGIAAYVYDVSKTNRIAKKRLLHIVVLNYPVRVYRYSRVYSNNPYSYSRMRHFDD